MKEEKKYPPKISLILRIVVSVYLLYLVWGLKGAPASHTGTERVFFIVAMIVFAVVAVLLGGTSLKAFIKGEYDKPDNNENE